MCWSYVFDFLVDGSFDVSRCTCFILNCCVQKTRCVIFNFFLPFTFKYQIFMFLDVNWGSTTQAQTYKNALNSVQQLNSVEEHVKNYRPQILVLTGMPSSRPPLIDFSYLLTKNLSLLICGHITEVRFDLNLIL